MEKPPYNLNFEPNYGRAVQINEKPLVRRVTAPNANGYTFKGTNTYLVGFEQVCVIDPGPNLDDHLDLLVKEAEMGGGFVSHIVLTHDHQDHIEGVQKLVQMTGANTFGKARPTRQGNLNKGDGQGFQPQVHLNHGDTLHGSDWCLEAFETPGHCSTHLCFTLENTDILFSGDHVMGWSSSVIFPPDGDLGAYLDSVEMLLNMPENTYLPGHGDIISDGKAMAKAQMQHREFRSRQYLSHLVEPKTITDLVTLVYKELLENLFDAAAATIEAHLLYMEKQHLVGRSYTDKKTLWQRIQ